jgi:DNA-binding response OmpR family regulator
MKILLAEDDESSRILVAGLLDKWGHQAILARDGEQAWAALKAADSPRLLILDWMMPGIDGLQLCRQAREQEGRDPFYMLLLTSRDQPQDVVQALEAGADDYVTKPFDRDELRARVQVGCRVLELQRKLRDRERLEGVLQTARTVCHEMNQPLQTVLGYSELLLTGLSAADPKHDLLVAIKRGTERLGQVTRRVMQITHANTKTYLGDPRPIAELAGKVS